MNVFCPYSSPLQCAQALSKDRRFNSQISECKQILKAIEGTSKAWKNHPVTIMYSKHKEWLKLYLNCFEAYKNYVKSDCGIGADGFINAVKLYSDEADKIKPFFLTDEFCNQHKRRLFTKSPKLYPQFAQYGKSDVNWYYVNNKIVKYKNSKQITD